MLVWSEKSAKFSFIYFDNCRIFVHFIIQFNVSNGYKYSTIDRLNTHMIRIRFEITRLWMLISLQIYRVKKNPIRNSLTLSISECISVNCSVIHSNLLCFCVMHYQFYLILKLIFVHFLLLISFYGNLWYHTDCIQQQ